MIIYQDKIFRGDLIANPNRTYLFGDNFIRKGYGGQAKEMRGEPNAYGIVTKRFPSMDKKAFLTDKHDYDKVSSSI
tara:strand:- start:4060 stop:4287 length:228 start_codon:yes stop_codon:yes gene_type:complete